MNTSTNTLFFVIMNAEEIRELAGKPVEEKLDRFPSPKSSRRISSAMMWKIHHQRRGINMRSALR